jgi:hypothetical protein
VYRDVPLLLYSGLSLAMATPVVCELHCLNYVGNEVVTAVALAAVVMTLASLVLIVHDRKGLFGYRLAFAGLYLAAVPLIIRIVAVLSHS